MEGFATLFTTRTPTEDETRDLFDDRIIFTDSNTWDPENFASLHEIRLPAMHLLFRK